MRTDLENFRITVAGLGRFGGNIAAARWLVQQGAKVLVTDQAPAEKLQASVEQLAGLPIEFHLGGHAESDFTQADLVVASPAIPPSNPFLQLARKAGVPITTEIKLFIERLPTNITTLAVTGTKGKSTTTTLLSLMLKKKYTVHTGGNIGKSLLFDLPTIHAGDLVLLELSSFMLEYLRSLHWSPHVAVYTFIGEDHLDWHGGVEGYLSAKGALVESQTPDDFVVYDRANAPATMFASHSQGKKIPFGAGSARCNTGVSPVSNAHGRDAHATFTLRIPGAHNQLNAQAAFTAAVVMGISFDQAQAAVRDFAGLPHRLQLVHEIGGVRYINDSIATIPQAAIAALVSFSPKSVIQIVGGYDKHLDCHDLIRALDERAKAVLCIGATGPAIAAALAEIRSRQSPPVHSCNDLTTAMILARRLAVPGNTVLLSTGFASYDQFTNFEQRGDMFAELAKQGRG